MRQESSKQGSAAAGRELPVMIALLLVFAVAAVWVLGRIQADYESYPAYSTHSPKPEGAKALWLFCQELGLAPEQFFESEYDYPNNCAMVVLHEDGMESGAWLFDPYDCSAVIDWVEEGNCLIIGTPPQSMLASLLEEKLDGQGYGSFTADPRVVGQFLQAGRGGQSQAILRAFQPGQRYELSDDRPELWRNTEIIETAGGFGASYLASASVLLAVSNPPEPIVLHFSMGEGEVLWLLRPEVLANDWLDRSDNAQLAWTLMTYASKYGPLYFDEHVHGYARPHKNTLQLMFTTTGGWLILAGLGSILLLLAGRAVQPARFIIRPVTPRRDSTEMVLAQADLYRRARVTGLLGRGLLDSYRRALQAVLRDGATLDEAAFRDVLGRLRARSGGGRPLVARFLETGAVPQRPVELAAFAHELGSLLEQARREPHAPGLRRRLQ